MWSSEPAAKVVCLTLPNSESPTISTAVWGSLTRYDFKPSNVINVAQAQTISHARVVAVSDLARIYSIAMRCKSWPASSHLARRPTN